MHYYLSQRQRLAVSTHGQVTLLKECRYFQHIHPPPSTVLMAAAAILFFMDESQKIIGSTEIPRTTLLERIQLTVHKLSSPQAFLEAILKNVCF